MLRQLQQQPMVQAVFFGNYFYGICVVALAVEAGLQQGIGTNGFLFYLMLFLGTVLFYNQAYIPSRSVQSSNPRTRWYAANRKNIIAIQWVLAIVLVKVAIIYSLYHRASILQLQWHAIFLILLFPLVALLYYGIDHHYFGNISLRSIGWLKPFVVAFPWAGMATIYPVIFHQVESTLPFNGINTLAWLLFLKNFLFIAVLAIMFDIKDYADDQNRQVKTFVVQRGVHTTIYAVLIPLTLLALGMYLSFAISLNFSTGRIVLNTIPFLLLLLTAFLLQRRKSIFFYLVWIDGLMLIKAGCGIFAALFFQATAS